jgi:hypothetical protein
VGSLDQMTVNSVADDRNHVFIENELENIWNSSRQEIFFFSFSPFFFVTSSYETEALVNTR